MLVDPNGPIQSHQRGRWFPTLLLDYKNLSRRDSRPLCGVAMRGCNPTKILYSTKSFSFPCTILIVRIE